VKNQTPATHSEKWDLSLFGGRKRRHPISSLEKSQPIYQKEV